jgi:hypothetical protein
MNMFSELLNKTLVSALGRHEPRASDRESLAPFDQIQTRQTHPAEKSWDEDQSLPHGRFPILLKNANQEFAAKREGL